MEEPKKRGRKALFTDPFRRAKAVAMISAGISRRGAADYVGVHQSTFHRTMDRDPTFAAEVLRAEA